jgi:hypothetical protein|tara:strand:- start:254 stop:802 length:549 start_codon:yes stop_codon:yes gene_type:complete
MDDEDSHPLALQAKEILLKTLNNRSITQGVGKALKLNVQVPEVQEKVRAAVFDGLQTSTIRQNSFLQAKWWCGYFFHPTEEGHDYTKKNLVGLVNWWMLQTWSKTMYTIPQIQWAVKNSYCISSATSNANWNIDHPESKTMAIEGGAYYLAQALKSEDNKIAVRDALVLNIKSEIEKRTRCN